MIRRSSCNPLKQQEENKVPGLFQTENGLGEKTPAVRKAVFLSVSATETESV